MRLPNKFGSVTKLSGKRRKPFIARGPVEEIYHTDTKIMTAKRQIIGYYETRKDAIEALAEYNRDPYDADTHNLTFAEVYQMYYDDKYVHGKKKLSKSAEKSTMAAFKNCKPLHGTVFADVKAIQLQKVIDDCPLKYASLELIKNLYRQMYAFAIRNDLVEKDYSGFISINIPDDDESGVPFTEDELQVLWAHKDEPVVDTILIMIYSGYRIAAFKSIDINLEDRYFRGGVKTKAGKSRIVPIHQGIYDLVASYGGKTWLVTDPGYYRNKSFYPCLGRLGLATSSQGTKHTPHDCRHTFSWLCDHYGVDDLSKHMLMGHALGNDVESNTYGHRTLAELRTEIEKIKA